MPAGLMEVLPQPILSYLPDKAHFPAAGVRLKSVALSTVSRTDWAQALFKPVKHPRHSMRGGLHWAGAQRNTAKTHIQNGIKMQVFLVGTVNSARNLFANPSPFLCGRGAIRFSFE